MKKIFIGQIVGILSILLLLGAGCSYIQNSDKTSDMNTSSLATGSEADKARHECEQIHLNDGLCTQQLESQCRALQGMPVLKNNLEAGQKEIFCSFGEDGECTQNELMTHTCFVQRKGDYDISKAAIIKDGKIFNFKTERGVINEKDVTVYLDDAISATFNSEPTSLSFWNGMYSGEDRPDSDFDYFFNWNDLQITTQLNAPYGKGTEKIKKTVNYRCGTPFIEGSPYFYCETNGKDFLTQYEFNAATSFAVVTGGDYIENWKKITVRKVGNHDVFFIVPMGSGESRSSDEAKNKKGSEGIELASQKYLDLIISREKESSEFDSYDTFVNNMKLELKK